MLNHLGQVQFPNPNQYLFNSSFTSGVMPKRGLDVATCEVFRFYRLIVVKDLVEPLSMIVPRKEVVKKFNTLT